MYCLRYFLLVLLFFPFPTAPPFLVFLFLISLTVEHRPCAYCSLLLSAILLSTCSWNISSVDVSPVYSDEYVHESTGSFLSSILSFFKSNEQLTGPTQPKNHTGFKIIKQENHDKPEPINRCWCYSNRGRLFEPVSSKKKELENLDLPEGYQPLSQSQAASSPSQILKTSTNDEGTNEDSKLDHTSLRKPSRQLKSIFSPLWKPLTKLSSARSPLTGPHLSAKSPSSLESTIKAGTSSRKTKKIPKSTPLKVYRSSFSRTPLIYSHVIQPLIQSITPKLPLPVIRRIILIINYNFLEVREKLVELRWIQDASNFFNSFKFPFLRDLFDHYRSSQPHEIRLNQLIAVRVFLGTRAS